MAKILVVDDHFESRKYLKYLLGHSGHAVSEAANGEEALEVVATEHPDLVILDILMPKMDGIEFVGALRSDPQNEHTALLLISAGYQEHELREVAAACNVSVFLTKPAEPAVVLKAVNEALGGA